MKTPKQQITEFFQSYNIEVEYQDVSESFFAEVRNVPLPLEGKDVGEFCFETVSIYFGGKQSDYRFGISIILGKVTDVDDVVRYCNDYNCNTYGWKAELERIDVINPFFSFEYELEFVQSDRIGDVMRNAFEELCTMSNAEYFYPLMRLQISK